MPLFLQDIAGDCRGMNKGNFKGDLKGDLRGDFYCRNILCYNEIRIARGGYGTLKTLSLSSAIFLYKANQWLFAPKPYKTFS